MLGYALARGGRGPRHLPLRKEDPFRTRLSFTPRPLPHRAAALVLSRRHHGDVKSKPSSTPSRILVQFTTSRNSLRADDGSLHLAVYLVFTLSFCAFGPKQTVVCTFRFAYLRSVEIYSALKPSGEHSREHYYLLPVEICLTADNTPFSLHGDDEGLDALLALRIG